MSVGSAQGSGSRRFLPSQGQATPPARWSRSTDSLWYADILVGLGLAGLLYAVIALATSSHHHPVASAVSLSIRHLPLYAIYSLGRMLAAYILSLAFSLVYGYLAVYNRRAEKILVPILDILQSVPILSFLPSIVLALIALFPHGTFGVELASILLVFTSQAWNMTFSFYHSLLTIPSELREVSALYGLSPWQRFRQLELPYSAVGLVWNSMMSWAGGWFFLMAAEMFTLGNRSFQLPGLGSYLQVAANRGDGGAEVAGIGMLILVIVLLDQLVWRPLLAWADRFKIELATGSAPPRSAVLMLLRRSRMVEWSLEHVLAPGIERLDQYLSRPSVRGNATGRRRSVVTAVGWVLTASVVLALGFALWKGAMLLATIPLAEVWRLPLGALLSTLRVFGALLLSMVWTVPVGVFIGLSRNWAARLQPVAQILASIPATALFPIIVVWLLALGVKLGVLSVFLIMLASQWYILFNVIAGAMSIPQDLKEATALFRLSSYARWRILILPGIFPFLVTGLITAAGGAWNATIVTEYVQVAGRSVSTLGLGSLIATSSAQAQYGMLLASTLLLSLVVVVANRLVWRRMYHLAETRYTLLL